MLALEMDKEPEMEAIRPWESFEASSGKLLRSLGRLPFGFTKEREGDEEEKRREEDEED